MSASLRTLAVALLAVGVSIPAIAAHTLLPAPSTWTLDVGKSDFGGIPGMKSDVMHVLVDNEKWFKYTDVMVEDSGNTIKNGWSGPQDGTIRPVQGMPGSTAGFKLADDTGHLKMPDGTTADSVMTLSEDKKTLTFEMTWHMKDGKTALQKLIYSRTK